MKPHNLDISSSFKQSRHVLEGNIRLYHHIEEPIVITYMRYKASTWEGFVGKGIPRARIPVHYWFQLKSTRWIQALNELM